LFLDYLHYQTGRAAKRDRWSMLRLTRMGLVIMNLAIAFKWFSYFFPRVQWLAFLLEFDEDIGPPLC